MTCKKCDLNSYREKRLIKKKHCRQCMSNFYMEQAVDFCKKELAQPKEKTIDITDAIFYSEVSKEAHKIAKNEVDKFLKKDRFLSRELLRTMTIQEIVYQPNILKMNKVIEDKLVIENLSQISCIVKNNNTNNSYHVTLDSCTCTDFRIHKRPCKHMYKLAFALGILDMPYEI